MLNIILIGGKCSNVLFVILYALMTVFILISVVLKLINIKFRSGNLKDIFILTYASLIIQLKYIFDAI